MIKLIFKQIWHERRSNAWLLIELLLVSVFVWYVTDRYMVDFYTYWQPTGFDVSHTYRIKLSQLEEGDAEYITPDESDTDTDNLLHLIQRLRNLPEVETASVSYFSSIYSRGNASRNLLPDDGEVYDAYNEDIYYNFRRVTPEFFDVFRIRSENGERIDPSVMQHNSIVISKDLKEKIFPGKQIIGQSAYTFWEADTTWYTVSAVSTPVRNTEYERAEPCYFGCMTGPSLVDNVTQFSATRCEFIIRVHPTYDKDFINTFTRQTGDNLKAGNLYVSGIEPIEKMRTFVLYRYWKEQKTNLSLVLFVLLNVFFGIIATFWLRTGYRRGEMGLRMALGSERKQLFRLLFTEGLCLLLLTLIPVAVIALNIVFMDYMDTYRVPFTAGRFLIGIGITYLLMFTMIALGIWYPARRSAEVQPAEALHYE